MRPSLARLSQKQAPRLRTYRPKVLYADRGLIFVDKPDGLVIQTNKNEQGSDSDDLSRYYQALKTEHGLGDEFYHVHRLDKGTTGALVLANSRPVARDLASQFAAKTVEKTYLALAVNGERSRLRDLGYSGAACVPLLNKDGRMLLASLRDKGHKVASTNWEVLAESPSHPLSLVRLKLETGYKHQLRVTLAMHLNAPILGDTLYASRETTSLDGLKGVSLKRVFLHSSTLSVFRHDARGKRHRLSVTAPLPRDFVSICAQTGIPLEPDSLAVTGSVFIDGAPLVPADSHIPPSTDSESTQP